MRRLVLALPALMAACATAPSKPTAASLADPALVAKLDGAGEGAVAQGPLLGMQLRVIRDSSVLLDKNYGISEPSSSQPVTADTIFEIGSLTKQFTAAGVLQLVDAGKVRLDDPISKYLPKFSQVITIAQLLNQTSGLPDYARPNNLGKSRDALTEAISAMPLDFKPGSQWAYSNSNYYVLGRVIEIASGENYADYVSHHLFLPAGMTSSSACAHEVHRALGSVANGSGFQPAPEIDPDFYFASGVLCSTANDLARWQAALFGGKLLQPSSLTFMVTPAKLADGTTAPYGAGIVVDTVGGHRRWWHNGAMPNGFESELAYYPDDHLQIAILTNTLHQQPAMVLGKLDRDLAKVALGIIDAAVQDLPLPADAESRYVGTFSLSGLDAKIVIRDGKLHAIIGGKKDLELLNQGDDRFAVKVNPSGTYHFLVEANRATAIELANEGTVIGRLTRAVP